jgi:CRP-like cAMP-binding protein
VRADPKELIRLPLFRHLPLSALAPLVSACPLIEVERGACVIHEGTPGESALLLVAGRLQATTALGGCRLGITLPGDIVGERALLERSPTRSARLVALDPARLLLVQPATLRALEGSLVGLALELAVLRGVSDHLRSSTKALVALPPQRAAEFEAPTAPQAEAPTFRLPSAGRPGQVSL